MRDATVVPPGAGPGAGGPVGGTAVPARRPGEATTVEQYTALVRDARTRIEGLLHHTLGLEVRVRVISTQPEWAGQAVAIGPDGLATEGRPTGCLVTFAPSAARSGADGQRSTVAH